ncbi:MAG: 16S rRNA (cytidine(1402)-2'-O)-methyltransferase [Candidatus Auribacterota bacterium]|jgi:16S rRNA (cytidine1402-2'-O)-methyltransferase|nr:16S rRNA (cytidine(1402)-2'-O)-methyltransferase [Candidatus Auribacterota bacterium]
MSYGTLYVVATPIGNLDDISLRALQTLKSVDVCLAEDTRHTQKLFAHFDIPFNLKSCYRFNEKTRVNGIIDMLEKGKSVALVSDAGMPGISDPGERIIREVIDAGLPVTVIPGACSPLVALVLSGMRMDRFAFEGFLPRKGNKRNKLLRKIESNDATSMVFESALRIEPLLADILAICGDRKIALCRELTKLYEDVQRGSCSQMIGKLSAGELKLKGEFVVVIEGRESFDKRLRGA